MLYLYVPFAIQGFAMFFDEFYFHHRRGLPRWERLGHPLDTFSVLICYLYMVRVAPEEGAHGWLLGAMAFSCFLITKDEFVHSKECDAFENWLHSVLFVLHPIVFFAAYSIWEKHLNETFLILQAGLTFFFMLYQIFFWSFFEKRQQRNL